MRRLLWLLARYAGQAGDHVLDAVWDHVLDAVGQPRDERGE